MTTMHAGLELDVATSTIVLAGYRFPACGLRCPLDEDWPYTDDQRVLVDITTLDENVYVPMESGALINIERFANDGINARLYARTCEHQTVGSETLWLPHSLQLEGRRVVVGWQEWQGCEPEWLVEHIDRVATYSYDEPPGPACELLLLSDFKEGHSG